MFCKFYVIFNCKKTPDNHECAILFARAINNTLTVFHSLCRTGGLVVSVPASGSSDPSSSFTICSSFVTRNVNHETFREICSARREGGIGATVGESRTFPRYVSRVVTKQPF